MGRFFVRESHSKLHPRHNTAAEKLMFLNLELPFYTVVLDMLNTQSYNSNRINVGLEFDTWLSFNRAVHERGVVGGFDASFPKSDKK
jgi:hypothetical protein